MSLIQEIWDQIKVNPVSLASLCVGAGSLIGAGTASLLNAWATIKAKELEVNKIYFEKTLERRLTAYRLLEECLEQLGQTRVDYHTEKFHFALFSRDYPALEEAIKNWIQLIRQQYWISQGIYQDAWEIYQILDACRDTLFPALPEAQPIMLRHLGEGLVDMLHTRVKRLNQWVMRDYEAMHRINAPGLAARLLRRVWQKALSGRMEARQSAFRQKLEQQLKDLMEQ